MGTISNKLTYLNETKQKLKDDLNKFGAELTENDTFRSYSNVLNDIYDKLPRVTGNGSSFTLEDAQNGYLDDFKMYGNTEQTLLPSGYTQVDYIESSGTQYIDTGININTTTSRYETKIKPSSVSGTMGIFGTRNYSSANPSAMNVFIISGTFRLDWLSGNGNCNVRNISSDTDYTISITRGLATINNVDYTSTETSSIDSTYPFYVGSFNNAGSVFSTGFSGKTYYSKLYNNNNLVFDGVPCYRNSDNEIGMYDLVSNTFFTNQGTGTFTYGSVVPNPDPNPDYPQDVRVVTSNNTINVSGKNLFNVNLVERGTSYNYGTSGSIPVSQSANNRATLSPTNAIKVKPNTTYTINHNLTWRLAVAQLTKDKISLGDSGWKTSSTMPLTITTNANCEYIGFNFSKSDNSIITNNDWNTFINSEIQLEQSAEYPINLGTMELCKIGSYQDYIYKDNGKWYIHKEIGKVVLDGSDDEGWSHRAFPDHSYLSVKRTMQIGANGGYCDKFISNNNYDIAEEHMTISKQWKELCFAILKSRLATGDVAGFKTWLSTHNTIAYYVLATPTNEEITDTTLIGQLNAIETYTGTNTFSVSNSNDVLPTINVERLKELDKLN